MAVVKAYKEPAFHFPTFDEDDWRQWAACRDEDPSLFVPDGYSGRNKTMVRKAKAICSRCSVRDECLAYAYRIDDRHAILGGTTPNQRMKGKEQ